MKKIKLEEGEVICNKCKGKGIITELPNNITWNWTCPKCLGAGKLDWVSNAMCRPKPISFDYIYDQMAKELAEKIDKEIIEAVLASSTKPEKHSKLYHYNDKIEIKICQISNSKDILEGDDNS